MATQRIASKARKKVSTAMIDAYAKKSLKRWVTQLFDLKQMKPFLPLGVRHSHGEEVNVDLTVCSASEMTKINRQFRGKNKPTDVLSFPATEFFWIQGMLGDLVLCSDVLIAQAKQQNHSWKHEIDVLIVHGLLHLLGFDHELGPREAKKMQAMEERLLQQDVMKKTSAKKITVKKKQINGLISRSR